MLSFWQTNCNNGPKFKFNNLKIKLKNSFIFVNLRKNNYEKNCCFGATSYYVGYYCMVMQIS